MTRLNLRRYAVELAIVAGVVCLALPAAAQITASAHDLNSYVPAITMPNGRICVACHTPHNANSTDAPLWNHAASAGGHIPYTSSSIDAVDLGAPKGVSLLCLSCHDGSAALDSFGAGTRTDNTPGTVTLTGTALFGLDMTTDHPVSFTYDAALSGTDGELHNPTTENSGIGSTIDQDMLFGASNDQLECASCHDVHNGTSVVEAPLLIKTNTGSALCLTCHNK